MIGPSIDHDFSLDNIKKTNSGYVNKGSSSSGMGLTAMLKQTIPMIIMGQQISGKQDMTVIFNLIGIAALEYVCVIFAQIITFLVNKYWKMFENKSSKLIEKHTSILKTDTKITSSITIPVAMDAAARSLLSSAILQLVTKCKNVKSIAFHGTIGILNTFDPVQISDQIWIKLIVDKNSSTSDLSSSSSSNTEEGNNLQTLEIFSYDLNVQDLREFLDNVTLEYERELHNKLGNNLYFFNDIPIPAYEMIGPNGEKMKDYSKMPPNFMFFARKFTTNRSFQNLYGPLMKKIRDRVEFFIHNKKWYDDRGIPYTLGLLLSGPPGTGKTSIVKCIANETRRHIVNVNFHNDMTKMQMENLFFDESLTIVKEKMTEKYKIPIDRRIYLFSEIDCQGGIVNDRKINEKLPEEEEDDLNEDLICPTSDDLIDNLIPKSKSYAYFKNRTMTNGNRQPLQQNQQQNLFRSNKNNYSSSSSTSSPSSVDVNQLTMGVFLSVIDGVLETPGRILIMDANHIDKLDPALIRPGRVDINAKLGYCTNDTICDMIESFYRTELSEIDKQAITTLVGSYTACEIQNVLLNNIDDLNNALSCLIEMDKSKEIS